MVGTWDAQAIVASQPVRQFRGEVWRVHGKHRRATEYNPSPDYTGRYNLGRNRPDNLKCSSKYGPDDIWPVINTSTAPHVALAERVRHSNDDPLMLRTAAQTKLWAEFSKIVDLTRLDAVGITKSQLLADHDYTIAQELAGAARELGFEGILVPSATNYSEPNLILFPENFLPTSVLREVETVIPRLYRD